MTKKSLRKINTTDKVNGFEELLAAIKEDFTQLLRVNLNIGKD